MPRATREGASDYRIGRAADAAPRGTGPSADTDLKYNLAKIYIEIPMCIIVNLYTTETDLQLGRSISTNLFFWSNHAKRLDL